MNKPNNNKAQQVYAAKKIHIPSKLVRALQELDPMLDSGWERKTRRILRILGPDEIRFVYGQYLEPKGIGIDKESKRLYFKGRESLKEALEKTATSALRALGTTLLGSLAQMRGEQRPEAPGA